MTEYRRPLSSGEKSMLAFNELRPPFVIQLTVEGQGELDPDALYDALAEATAANPGAAVILEEGTTADFWVPGPAPTLTIVDAPDFAAQGTEDAPFLRWHLDAKTGPTCELVYVTGKDHSYLIFRALHAVMDGQGTLLWAKDVMRCLRKEPPIGHSSMLDVQTLCKDELENRRPLPKHDALHPVGPPKFASQGRHIWRRLRVERSLGIDATGRVAMAIAQQCYQNNPGPGPVRIHLPTDLRAYCRRERSTANLFGSLFIDIAPDSTPEAIGQRIVRALYEREGKRPAGLYASEETGSLNAHRVKAFMDLTHLHNVGGYAFSTTLSHLGRLDGASLSAHSWRATSALFIPLIADACVVSLNGFDEHIEVTAGVGDRFDGELFLGMMEAVREELLLSR
ncbi:MAG: hypothetical protein AAF449_03070 [Myxococcota bacterium]